MNELVEAAGEKILAKTTALYGRVGLLCIDEFGRMEFPATRRDTTSSTANSA